MAKHKIEVAQALLKRREVERRTGLPRSTLYARMAAGEFPKPIKTGLRGVAWLESEVGDWLASRVALRDKAAGERAQ